MVSEKTSVDAAEKAFTNAPIPTGTKRVRETKVEIYTEPIAPPPNVEGSEGVSLGTCVFCPDDVLTTEDIVKTSGGWAHTDCISEPEAQGEPADPPPPSSPADRFLSSLKIDEGRGIQLRIYVYREPDPIGAPFRNPYSGPRKSVGPLEYDASFDSAAAVEAYVQRLHHGGSYYFEVREAGKYATSWGRLIDDPPVAEKREVAATASVGSSVAPVTDSLDHLVATSAKLKQIADAMGWSKRERGVADNVTAPSVDALTSITSSIALVQSVMDLSKQINPTPAAAGGNGERTTADSVLDFTRELGIGEVAREFLKPLAAVTGALLADSIAQSRARKAAEARAAMNIPPQPNVGTPTVQAPSQQISGTVEPSHFAATAGNVTRETYQEPGAGSREPVLFDAQTVEFLRPIVDDMVKGNEGGVDRAVESTLGMIQLQKMFGQDAMPFVVEVVAKSGYELLAWLGDGNPEWRGLRQSREAADYIAFLDDFCEAVQEELKTAAEGDGEDVSRETSGVDQEAAQIDMSNLVLHDPAAETESEPGAVATGQNVSRETSGAESSKLETGGVGTKDEEAAKPRKSKPAVKTS